MAKLLPLSKKQKLQSNRRKRAGIVTAPAAQKSIAIERWYFKQLTKYLNAMHRDIEKRLYKQLTKKEHLYLKTVDGLVVPTMDDFVDDFEKSLDLLTQKWTLSSERSKALASQVVGRVDAATQARISRTVGQAMGVDLAQIVRSEGLTTAVKGAVRENTQLIKSIPGNYLADVERIVMQETVKGRTSASIIDQLQSRFNVTEKRARLIARDQTNKINGEITRQRQLATGIRAFRWRTVGDEAVRKMHKERNGLIYAWAPEFVGQRLEDGTILLDPAADDIGYPGEPIQCRCIAEPIIELNRL